MKLFITYHAPELPDWLSLPERSEEIECDVVYFNHVYQPVLSYNLNNKTTWTIPMSAIKEFEITK